MDLCWRKGSDVPGTGVLPRVKSLAPNCTPWIPVKLGDQVDFSKWALCLGPLSLTPPHRYKSSGTRMEEKKTIWQENEGEDDHDSFCLQHIQAGGGVTSQLHIRAGPGHSMTRLRFFRPLSRNQKTHQTPRFSASHWGKSAPQTELKGQWETKPVTL